MHQWLGSRKTSHPYTKGILDKNCLSCGQPFRDYSNMKLLVFKSKVKMTVLTLLPCGRKNGLFGHVVTKSRKAWQTMELYPNRISEVHQTHPCHRKVIWACRECLGHPISKKNNAKRSFFGWVIPRMSFCPIYIYTTACGLMIDIYNIWTKVD